MKRKLFEIIRKESKYLGMILLALLILLKIAFFRESIISVIKISAVSFLVFLIPGYLLSIRWYDKFHFTERIMVSSFFTITSYGLLGYYLGLIGLHIKHHIYVLPILISALGIALFLKKKDNRPDDIKD